MPAVACKNCGILIEYWPRPGGGAVSCTSCKRVTMVPADHRPQTRSPRTTSAWRASSREPRAFKLPSTRRAGAHGARLARGAAKLVAAVAICGLGALVIPPILKIIANFAKEAPVSTASVYQSEANPLRRALEMPENQPFVSWLAISTDEEPPPEPQWARLVFASWEDHSNRKFFDKGQEWINNDPPMNYQIDVRLDTAAADAVEQRFGRPANANPPATWAYEGDGSRAAVNAALERKQSEIAKCHGYREGRDTFGPDYDWLIARSRDACECVAPAVVQAVTGKKPDAVSVRQRVEALTSFVQNAIPYTYEVERELESRHHDGASRMGIRPPATALLRGGDCDTKSLLLAALIRSVDPTVPLALIDVLDSDFPRENLDADINHAIAGVAIQPKPGERTLTRGKITYVLIESTHDWDVGRLSNSTKLDTARVNEIE